MHVGGYDRTGYRGPFDYSVFCLDCGASTRRHYPKEEEAVEAWNRRTPNE